jgi:hypothetical protein
VHWTRISRTPAWRISPSIIFCDNASTADAHLPGRIHHAPLYDFRKREDNAVHFAIEIYIIDKNGAEDVVHRTPIDRINVARARKEARRLFAIFKRRRGLARLVNAKGETVYTVTE